MTDSLRDRVRDALIDVYPEATAEEMAQAAMNEIADWIREDINRRSEAENSAKGLLGALSRKLRGENYE